jgi:hypothetical protein
MLLGSLAAGCVKNQESLDSPNTILLVSSAPPAAKSDTQTAPPGPGYIWVAGHWSWQQEQWVWIRGRWEEKRPGYTFVMPRYEDRDGRQVYVLGGWVPEAQPTTNGGAGNGAKTP